MKKLLLTVAFALLTATGTLFAQNRVSFSLDIAPLIRANLLEAEKVGVGGAFAVEFFVADSYSLGVRAEALTVFETKAPFIGLDGHFRYYWTPGESGCFFDMGLGYALKYINETDVQASGLMFSLKLGYRLFLVGGLFLEPALGYTLAKPTGGYGPGGFDLGLSLGFAI